jgi:hypothetical protein
VQSLQFCVYGSQEGLDAGLDGPGHPLEHVPAIGPPEALRALTVPFALLRDREPVHQVVEHLWMR